MSKDIRFEDRKIVQDIVRKNEKALHKLYYKYNLQIIRFVYKRIPNRAVAEEITQDVFIELMESLRSFRHQCSLKTFIFTIARNKIIDHIRKRKLKRILFSHLPEFVVEGLSHVTLEDDLEKKDLQEKMQRTFNELPHDYALILRLKYIEEKSVKEIAKRLIRSFKSTESLLYRARKAFIQIYSTKV